MAETARPGRRSFGNGVVDLELLHQELDRRPPQLDQLIDSVTRAKR
jgi:hypothetical protein